MTIRILFRPDTVLLINAINPYVQPSHCLAQFPIPLVVGVNERKYLTKQAGYGIIHKNRRRGWVAWIRELLSGMTTFGRGRSVLIRKCRGFRPFRRPFWLLHLQLWRLSRGLLRNIGEGHANFQFPCPFRPEINQFSPLTFSLSTPCRVFNCGHKLFTRPRLHSSRRLHDDKFYMWEREN